MRTKAVCDEGEHEAVKRDDAEWNACVFIGIQDLGEGETAELRNHVCGSTLARRTQVDVMPDRRSAL